jgi:hypothetical protein
MPRDVDKETVEKAFKTVMRMMEKRLKRKGRGPYLFTHQIDGIIDEEFNLELKSAMHKNDLKEFRSELIDIAVAAIFGIASIDAGAVST